MKTSPFRRIRVPRRRFVNGSFAFGVLLASVPFVIYLMFVAPSESAHTRKLVSTNNMDDRPFAMSEWTENNANQQLQPQATISTSSLSRGLLNVHTWSDICGGDVNVLRNWPHFPYFPDKRSFVSDFHRTQDNETQNNGERCFGFIHPEKSGEYKFAITSDDTSELWLSPNEDPASSKMIARVYSPDQTAWTLEGDYKKYPEQISKEITLLAGKRYYIETLSKQGFGDAHVAVYWFRTSSNSTFEIISSKYLSSFFEEHKDESIPPHAGKKANISPKRKWNLYDFNHLPFINKEEYISAIPSCSYSPSFLVRKKLKRFDGVGLTNNRVSNVFPQDDTDMLSKFRWSQPNPVIDKNRVEPIVNKFVSSLGTNHKTRNYFLQKIYKVIQKPDPVNGDRFVLDLILGINNTDKKFRLIEHVYQKKGSDDLCLPEGLNWNSSATIYFIVPVKDQGKWVHYFINQLTEASFITGDTNFHVIIVDFESKDINMAKALNTPLLRSRHTIIPMAGKFYKTLALNKAAEAVPNAHDIIFLFDLHIDVPADIMDSVRKNTIAGRIAYFPIVGRLDCGSNSLEHRGFWEWRGYGILSIYKSDWNRFGGMNTETYKTSWGGEDWDLLDRVLSAQLEAERIRHPGLYHHYHSKRKWKEKPSRRPTQ